MISRAMILTPKPDRDGPGLTSIARRGTFTGMTKLATSFRLSPEALRLLAGLAKRLGLSQAAVLELAIRQLARKEAR